MSAPSKAPERSILRMSWKNVSGTGFCLSQDGQHVVCFYILMDKDIPYKPSEDVLFLESDYSAVPTERYNVDGHGAVGYVAPGPFISCGRIIDPAGEVQCPAAIIGNTFWTGTGFIRYQDF